MDKVKIIVEALKGYKTYILATIGIILAGLWFFGIVDDTVAVPILTILGFGDIVALRSALKVAEK